MSTPCRAYHFASTQYAAAFGKLPDTGRAYADRLRTDAVAAAVAIGDSCAAWTAEPAVTLLRGESLRAGTPIATLDAWGRTNGLLVQATAVEVNAVVAHARGYRPPATDLRASVRAIETEYLAPGSAAAAALVACQALDFGKQDGVTEMIENVEAAAVERRMADALLADELAGIVNICRAPAFVACVSNFTNFLDLSRKVLRNLELGVPVVVLSRSNTAQHSFRWAYDLNARLASHGVDAGMFTFLAASLNEQRRAIGACEAACPLYFTGSRTVAAAIRTSHGRTFASTGGPNTLLATEATDAIGEAIRTSATIEHAGQCTALRLAVVPCEAARALEMLGGATTATEAVDALAVSEFAALLAPGISGSLPGGPLPSAGYELLPPGVHVRYSADLLPAGKVEEHWRHAVVDVTAPPSAEALRSGEWTSKLAEWLIQAQPISVAVNDNVEQNGFALALSLFEQTAVVVFTAGSLEVPALTCQARPQHGEVFGEVPPRRQLRQHTLFPVLVPSPTPAYNSGYAHSYLASKGKEWVQKPPVAPKAALALVTLAAEDEAGGFGGGVGAGYVAELLEYLQDALQTNPKRGSAPSGGRTALYGLQTTPLGTNNTPGPVTIVRISAGVRPAPLCAILLPFVATNAAPALRLSVDASHAPSRALVEALVARGAVLSSQVAIEEEDAFSACVSAESPFNVVDVSALAELDVQLELGVGLPLAGQLVSTLLCFGHAKSTRPDDEEFARTFGTSAKWLQMVAK